MWSKGKPWSELLSQATCISCFHFRTINCCVQDFKLEWCTYRTRCQNDNCTKFSQYKSSTCTEGKQNYKRLVFVVSKLHIGRSECGTSYVSVYICTHIHTILFVLLVCSLSYNRFLSSPKASSSQNEIWCFLVQFTGSLHFPQLIH